MIPLLSIFSSFHVHSALPSDIVSAVRPFLMPFLKLHSGPYQHKLHSCLLNISLHDAFFFMCSFTCLLCPPSSRAGTVGNQDFINPALQSCKTTAPGSLSFSLSFTSQNFFSCYSISIQLLEGSSKLESSDKNDFVSFPYRMKISNILHVSHSVTESEKGSE